MQVLLLALAPVFIILFYIYFRDKYEKEPISMLILSLVAGSFAVVPVMFAGQALEYIRPSLGTGGDAFYTSFIAAGLTEELFKFLALYILIWRNPNFNEKFDGIVYAVFVSLGFAAVENIMFVADGGFKIALVRSVTAVPAHAIFGIRMGYFFGIAHMYKELRSSYLIKALLIPVLLHGIYDFMLLSNISILLLAFIPYLIWMYFSGFRKMKVISDASVFRPVAGEQEENQNAKS
jgi:RsiW-degrading membrane proteinase PrsW (M82 family)